MRKLVAATLFLVACGDDIKPNNPTRPDAAVIGVDAMIDVTWTKPAVNSLGISAAGHDVIMSAVAGPNGGFYAVGWRGVDLAAPKEIIVIKLLATGLLDTTWAANGVLDTDIVFTGATDELDIETLASGDILVSATVAAAVTNVVDALDNDIALIKITAAGALDTTFGGGDGIIKHSFSESILAGTVPAPTGRDGVRSLDVRDNGEIFVFAYQRGEGDQTGMTGVARVDTDFVIAKFTAAGALDTANYGNGTGKYVRDIYLNSAHSNATPRGLTVLDTGVVIGGGYADTTPGTGTTGPQPVLIRLLANGTPDPGFATGGLYHEAILALQTEVYEIAIHGNKIVTGGYGRNTGDNNDYISLRYDLATGVRDTTWGGTSATDGKVFFDPTPGNSESGSNCRGALALPGGKTLLLGSSNRSLNSMATPNPTAQDAVFAVLDAEGKLDAAYGTGIATDVFGPDGQDAWWGSALSGNNVLVIGWKATVGALSATNNDDAYSAVFSLE